MSQSTLDDEQSNNDRMQALKECLERLSHPSKLLLRKRYEVGCDLKKIAKDLNKSAEAVRTALFRIRANLRACIKRRLSEVGGT